MSTPRGPRSDGQANRRRLLRLLLSQGPTTRAAICHQTGLSRATVSALVTHFLRANVIVEETVGAAPSRAGGRPPMLVRLGPRAGLAVGVDITERRLRVTVGDLGHQMLAEDVAELNLPAIRSMATVADITAEFVRQTVTATQQPIEDVVGVGLGIPAPIDGPSGALTDSVVFARLEGAPTELLSSRLGVPVVLENNANLGALGEHLWGAARGSHNFVYVWHGTGIGAGFVIGDVLYKGAWGIAGELGHMTLDPHGQPCPCGARGCLRGLADFNSIVRRLAEEGVEARSVPEILEALRLNHPAVRRIVNEAADALGFAIANAVNLLNPERVVVGGVVPTSDPEFLEIVRNQVLESGLRPATSGLSILPGALGERAVARGGVALLLTHPARSGVGERLRALAD